MGCHPSLPRSRSYVSQAARAEMPSLDGASRLDALYAQGAGGRRGWTPQPRWSGASAGRIFGGRPPQRRAGGMEGRWLDRESCQFQSACVWAAWRAYGGGGQKAGEVKNGMDREEEKRRLRIGDGWGRKGGLRLAARFGMLTCLRRHCLCRTGYLYGERSAWAAGTGDFRFGAI